MQVFSNQVLAPDLLLLPFTLLDQLVTAPYALKHIIHFCALTDAVLLPRMISVSVCLLSYTGTYTTLLFSEWSLPRNLSFKFSNCYSSSTHASPYRLFSSLMLGLFLLLLLTISHPVTMLSQPPCSVQNRPCIRFSANIHWYE